MSKENGGNIFINTKREKGSKQPNMRGDVKIDGVEYWVSAWSKNSEKAGKYLSLAFTRKDNQQTPLHCKPLQKEEELPF